MFFYMLSTPTHLHTPHTQHVHMHIHTPHIQRYTKQKKCTAKYRALRSLGPTSLPPSPPCVTSATSGITRPSTKQTPQAELIVALTSPSVVRALKIPQQDRTKSLSLSIPSPSQIPYHSAWTWVQGAMWRKKLSLVLCAAGMT